MRTLERNLKFAARQFGRNPGFTLTVIVTLALSIGANTAIFSMVNALLLKALPYRHPERMGTIYTRITESTDERHHVNGEQWELLRDHVPALISAVATPRTSGVNLESGSHAEYVHAGRVSAHYLDVLAISPVMGRNFLDEEDRSHGPRAAILSYGLWRNSFAADSNILGRAIVLKGEPYTVVGVLPDGVTTPLNADVYTTLQLSREGEGGGTNFDCITRLRDGASWQEADAEINRVWLARAGRYELKNNPGAQVTYHSVPLQRGMTDPLRPQVLALMLASGFILLIACANLAGLTLVRLLRRSSEVAARLALGALPWQIQQQFWTENLLLALVGGAAAVGLGFFTLRGLLRRLPDNFLPVGNVSLDIPVLAFTLIISLLTSVLFGMLPALAARRVDVRSSIARRGTGMTGGLRLRQALIASEVALTVVLLAASGLLIRTLRYLETLSPGFNPNGVIIAKASLDESRFHDPAAFRKLLDQSTAAIDTIPGVQHAAVGLSVPYERSMINGELAIKDGRHAGEQVQTDEVYVTPNYFETLQIPVLAGRVFTDEDGPNTHKVAIVNRTFMRKFFDGANAVGHYVDKDTVIVGVVEDVAVPPGVDPAAPLAGEQTIYVPAAQMDPKVLAVVHVWLQPSWIVRTGTSLEQLPAQMQHALESVDPNLPFSGFYSMRELLRKTLAMQRVEVTLLGTMSLLAFVLSAVGTFALVANTVTQRTQEIGIRMALGSTVGRAMVEIGRSGYGASVLGIFLGLVLCLGALRVMRTVIYGVGVYDAGTILAVTLMLALVALIASIVPTLRISRIDPAETLRSE